jgi:pseudouridine synthase
MENKKETIRLNKYISDSGFCSRREADQIINESRVTINDELAMTGMQVGFDDVVKVDGKVVKPVTNKVYLLLNKPTGVVCTNDLDIKGNIRQFVNYKELIFPVGRLDKDSTGLILLTNDGDIVNKILRCENNKEKEYIVTVDQDIDHDFITKMANGVEIYNPVSHKNQVTLKTKVTQVSHRSFKIILKQGLNRQIRRMTEGLGYKVKSLQRIRIMHLKINDLPLGHWRYLTKEELTKLFEMIN